MLAKFGMALLCALLCASPARADFIDLWANKLDMPLNKAPHTGHSKVLLIPVQIDYTGARAEQSRARSEGRLVGVGIGTYVEFTGAGSATFKGRGMVGDKLAAEAEFAAMLVDTRV